MIPSDMKEFNRKVVEEFRANRGRLSGQLANSNVLLLTTRGNRTGEPRTTVLGYRRDGDRFVVIASDYGAADHPAWYRNLLAQPTATVEVGADIILVRASTVDGPERDRLKGVVEYYDGQQKLTQREIPVVVLEPAAQETRISGLTSSRR
jgi:deazaflavin-dependent oxidoreductase (nitroreductase family)